MIYGSVCSGIEAATAAWHPLGWKPAFFSEIEKFPRAVLAHHYPGVPCHGDFTTIGADEYGAIDLLVGGTPCQDFSVAGLRQGITGERGNLTLEFVRLVERKKPRWVVWENVPGVLSIDGGRAFGAFLGGLGECGYGVAYRVLDAQYFGVPQRRRRVFVVGYLGDWRPAAAVLFERESLRRDITPRRQARESVAGVLTSRASGGGGGPGAGTDEVAAGYLQAVAPTLDARSGRSGENSFATSGGMIPHAYDTRNGLAPHGSMQGDHISPTLRAKEAEPPFITHTLRAEHDASEDGSGRGIPLICGTIEAGTHPGSYCGQDAYNDKLIPVAFDWYASQSQNMPISEECPPLKGTMQPAIAIDLRNATRDPDKRDAQNRQGCGIGDDLAHTVSAGVAHGVASFKPGQSAAARGIGYEENIAPSLEGGGGGNNKPALMQGMAVRRLTPRECERLQGFPDDYTLIPYYPATKRKLVADYLKYLMRGGKRPRAECYGLAADGPRYKALGNSMAVPVMAWIGDRIQKIDDLISIQ